MKPNIIILGAHGMLGWQVLKVFNNSNYKVKCQVRNKKSNCSDTVLPTSIEFRMQSIYLNLIDSDIQNSI